MSLTSSGGALPGTGIADASPLRSGNTAAPPWRGPSAVARDMAGEHIADPSGGLVTALILSSALWALIGLAAWWALS